MSAIDFAKIVPYLTHPLVLIGLVLFLVFGFFQVIIRAKLIPALSRQAGAKTLRTMLNYGFILALAVCVSAFAYQSWRIFVDYKQGGGVVRYTLERARAARVSVFEEMVQNIRHLSTLIAAVDGVELIPFSKFNLRRPNETELAYQERAKAHYRDYHRFVDEALRQFTFSDSANLAHQNDLLSLDSTALSAVRNAYYHSQSGFNYVNDYSKDILHQLSLQSSDTEMCTRLLSQKSERLLSARSDLFRACGEMCVLAENSDETGAIQTALGGDLLLQCGENGRQICTQKANQFQREKADVLKQRHAVFEQAQSREVSRRVSDPYLVHLRRMSGLSDELSDADIHALQSKELDEHEQDPRKLLTLAALSFMESDGQHAAIYLQRALDAPGLPQPYHAYVRASLDRLQSPDKYGESLGFYIIEIEEGGHFEKAGFIQADILIGLDEAPLLDPAEISQALGRSKEHPFLVKLLRNGQPMSLAVQPGHAAGATLIQLVCFQQVTI